MLIPSLEWIKKRQITHKNATEVLKRKTKEQSQIQT